MSSYGRYYYCIKTELSKNGEIYAHADTIVIEDGNLILLSESRVPTLCIAKGKWSCFYGASVIDGACVSVEHWEGEYIPKIRSK